MSKLYSTDPILLSDEILRRIEVVYEHNEEPFYAQLNDNDHFLVSQAIEEYRVKEDDYKYIRFLAGKLRIGDELNEIELQFLIKALYLKMLKIMTQTTDQDLYDQHHLLLNDILYSALGEKFTLEKIDPKGFIYLKNPKRKKK